MILAIPLFFFILSLFEVSHGKIGVLREKKPVRVSEGLDRLDFVSEAPLDLETLRDRYSVRYVYTRGN